MRTALLVIAAVLAALFIWFVLVPLAAGSDDDAMRALASQLASMLQK